MRNKTTEVTEGHRGGMFGIAEYIHEEVVFVQVNYARLLRTDPRSPERYPEAPQAKKIERYIAYGYHIDLLR